MSENKILRGHNEICRYLGLPWPVVWRLATAGGLPVKDLDGEPSLKIADWIAWQSWKASGHETSAQA